MFIPMAHQRAFAQRWGTAQRILNLSGCGTGKTGACIHAIQENWPQARVLVLGPLSILRPAWGGDLNAFWPQTEYDIAYAKNRRKVFGNTNTQWVISNHDAIKDIVDNGWHRNFEVLIVDEADAFRNKDSQRSKALAKATEEVPIVTLMTGTPTPKSILDIWHLAFCVDRGERLEQNFFGFRANVCVPKPVIKNVVKWVDKPQARDIVTAMLSDITFRVNLDDVVELPELITRTVALDLPDSIRRHYEKMRRESLIELETGTISAIHAGARLQKLLQILSGTVYDEQGIAKDVHKERHELVLDLVEESDASLVAFQWQHQRTGLEAEAKKRKIDYAFIDGTTSVKAREQIVEDYQNGRLQVIFAHPQSAGHGLTLTRGNRVIWASPTFRADLYEQFNHRIYRKGQKRKCEVLHVAANHTAEVEVYASLAEKQANMADLLALMVQMQPSIAA